MRDLLPLPERKPALDVSQEKPVGFHPIESFLNALLVRAPEYTIGSTVSGMHEYLPQEGPAGALGDVLQRVGERVSALAPDALRADVEATSSTPWFEDDGKEWYDPTSWSPSRLPAIANKAMSMFGENLPLIGATAASSWVGKKVIGGLLGAEVGPEGAVAGVIASELVVPGLLMGLQESRNFAKAAREAGYDPDIAAKYARMYGPASGLIEQSQQLANIGAFKAGKGAMNEKSLRGLRYIMTKMLRGVAGKLPEGIEEGMEEVSQDELMNVFMFKAEGEMKARHGEDWVPVKAVQKLTMADRADSFAGGALISGMMKASGYISRLATGRVSEGVEAKANEINSAIRVPLQTESQADSVVRLISEIHDKKGKGGIEEVQAALDERATRAGRDKISMAKIAALHQAGDTVAARRELERQTGIIAVPDNATGIEMLEIAEKYKQKTGSVPVYVDPLSGRRVLVMSSDMIGDDLEKATRMAPWARIEANDEDVSKFQIDMSTALKDDESMIMALGMPHDIQDGKVVASDSVRAEANRRRMLLQAMKDSGDDVRLGLVWRTRMTLDQFKQSGRVAEEDAERVFNSLGPTLDKDGKLRVAGYVQGTNYREDGKAVIIMHPGSFERHDAEEIVELAFKGNKQAEGKMADAFKRLRETVFGSFRRQQAVVSEVVRNIQPKHQNIADIKNPATVKQVLSQQANELYRVALTATPPALMSRDAMIGRADGLRKRAEAIDEKMLAVEPEAALQIQSELRNLQRTYGLVTVEDQMLDMKAMLDHALGDEKTANQVATELFSHAYIMHSLGMVEKMTPRERQGYEYLQFTPEEQSLIQEDLKTIFGDQVFKLLHEGRSVVPAKTFPLAMLKKDAGDMVASLGAAIPATQGDLIKALSAQVAELSKKIDASSNWQRRAEAAASKMADLRQKKGRASNAEIDSILNELLGLQADAGKAQAETPARPEGSAVATSPTGVAPGARTEPPTRPAGAAETSPKPSGMPQEAQTGKGVGVDTPPALSPPTRLPTASSIDLSTPAGREAALKAMQGIGEEDTAASDTIVTRAMIPSVSSDLQNPEDALEVTSAIRDAIHGSLRLLEENKRYRQTIDRMSFFYGDAQQAESVMLRLAQDGDILKKATDPSMSDEDFRKWLMTYEADLKNDPNSDWAKFKMAALCDLNVDKSRETDAYKKRDLAYFRSLWNNYSIYTPHHHAFIELLGSSVSDVLSGKLVSINRLSRLSEWKRRIDDRIQSIAADPIRQKAMQDAYKALDFNKPNRVAMSQYLEQLTGINAGIWLGATDAFWNQMAKSLDYHGRAILKGGNLDAMRRMIENTLVGIPEAMKGKAFKSNLEHLIDQSRDPSGWALHGRDHNGNLTIAAMTESPFRQAIKELAKKTKRDPSEMVLSFTGMKREDGKAVDWDSMRDSTRNAFAVVAMRMGYIAAPPFGDKTQSRFIYVGNIDTSNKGREALLAQYDALFNALAKDDPRRILFASPKVLREEVDLALRSKTVPAEMAAMVAAKAVHSFDFFQAFYGDLSKFIKKGKVSEAAFNAIKRGSQLPSGGPSYPGKVRVLLVNALGGGKLFDGQVFHSDDFAKEYQAQMGSEFNSDVIKPYFRFGDFGIKCASFRAGLFNKMDEKTYKAVQAIFRANPSITHIADENAIKFMPPGTELIDVLDSSGNYDASLDLSKHIVEMGENSMFVVQNLDKDAQAAEDLMSRQMIFATMGMPNARKRHELGNRIMKLMMAKIAEALPSGKIGDPMLRKLLESDRLEETLRALTKNGESQNSILWNADVLGAIFNRVRDMMEPKALRHSGTQVSEGTLDLPGYERGADGRNHMPWVMANVRLRSVNDQDVRPQIRGAVGKATAAEAWAYLNDNWQRHLDLAEFDEEGKPVIKDGKPVWNPNAVREWNGKFYVLGSLEWTARIPSDSLYSAAPGRLFSEIDQGSNVGVSLVGEKQKAAMGADHDADALYNSTFFVDNQGNAVFDDTIAGIMNRRLALLLQDYEKADLKHIAAEENHEADLEGLMAMMRRIAQKVGKKTLDAFQSKYGLKHPPINTPAFDNYMLNVYTAGKSMLGIAAKNNSATSIEIEHGARYLTGMKFGNVSVSLDEAYANRLRTDADLRYYQQMIIGRAMINFLVDDAKDPHASLILSKDTIPLALAAMRGMEFKPETVEAQLEGLFTWLNQSAEVKLFSELQREIDYGMPKFKAISSLMDRGGAFAELGKLWGIAEARRQIGRFSNFLVAAGAPQNTFELDGMVDLHSQIAGGAVQSLRQSKKGAWFFTKYGPSEDDRAFVNLFSYGNYADSVFTQASGDYISALKDQAFESPYRAISEFVRNSMGYMSEKTRERVWKALERAIAVRAVWKRGVDPRSLPARFQSISESYHPQSAAHDLFRLMIVDKDQLKLVPDYRITAMPKSVRERAQQGFEALTADHKADFFVYMLERYGVGKSTYGGSFWPLISNEYRKQMDARLSAKVEITEDIAEYAKAQKESSDSRQMFIPGVASEVVKTEPLSKYKDIPITRGKIESGAGARYDRATNTIIVDEANMKESWARFKKGPEAYRVKGALAPEGIDNYSMFYDFMLEHERQHSILGERPQSEDVVAYENRISAAAARELGLKFPEVAETIVRPVVEFMGEVFKGEIGQSHNDIIETNSLPGGKDIQRGFETNTGRFIYDRAEAARIAAKQGIETLEEPGMLHSSDLARGSAEDAETHAMMMEVKDSVAESMEAAKDLERILKSRFAEKIPPMPDEFSPGAGIRYERVDANSWVLRGATMDENEVLDLTEDQAKQAWLSMNQEAAVADFSEVAQTVEQWKRERGIKYDPNDAYSRGEGIYHDIGAFNHEGKGLFANIAKVLLKQERKLRAGDTEWWKDTENQLVVSGYTARTGTQKVIPPIPDVFEVEGHATVTKKDGQWRVEWPEYFDHDSNQWEPAGHSAATDEQANEMWVNLHTAYGDKKSIPVRPGSGPRLVIRPSSQDIVWAAVGDVYSGTVQKHKNKPIESGRDGYAIFSGSVMESGETAVAWFPTKEQADAALDRQFDSPMEWSEVRPSKEFQSTTVEPKAPSSMKLSLLANSLAAAIEGRRPENYNELGVRLRLGNFYIEGLPEVGVGTAGWKNVPSELQRLNQRLQQAFIRVHGSLDPVAPYTPKTITRAGGYEQTHALTFADRTEIEPIDEDIRKRVSREMNAQGSSIAAVDSVLRKLASYLGTGDLYNYAKLARRFLGEGDAGIERILTVKRTADLRDDFTPVRDAERTHAMLPALSEDLADNTMALDTGKYGVHRAYYMAHEEMQAQIIEANGHIAKWLKIVPAKDKATWELINRWIDDPGRYKSEMSGKSEAVRKLAEEVKQRFADVRDRQNKYMRELTKDEWMKWRENYINRVYLKKGGKEADAFRKFDTKHVNERKFDTISEAEDNGFKLAVTSAADLYRIYVADTAAASTRRMAIYSSFLHRDSNGDQQIIPVFKGQSIARPVIEAYDMPAVQQTTNNLSTMLQEAPIVGKAWGRLVETVRALQGKADPKKRNYILKPSPYEEFDGFWVHPDSESVSQSLLGERWEGPWMQRIERFNAWSKFMTLGLSLFHPFALWEATMAGLHGKGLQVRPFPFKFKVNDKAFMELLKDPKFVADAVRKGLNISPYPNIDNSIIARDLDRAMAWANERGNKAAQLMIGSLQKYKGWFDEKLWQEFHSGVKLYAWYDTVNTRMAQLQKEGKVVDREQLEQQVALAINRGFGGLAFDRMIWATPKVRQLMHLLMFAPDWTLTNLTSAQAGLAAMPGFGWLGKGISAEERRWAITKHWPGMLIFMLAWPNIVQAALYAAFGDPDRGDKMFASENEMGKEFSVDSTPLFRSLGWESKENPNERVYMRFAKQAWEVAEFAENPLKRAMGKTSSTFKLALEQITGVDGLGRQVPYAKEGFWAGLFSGGDEGFWGSRVGSVAEKFVPMSILSYLGGTPPTWLAPTSKGMSKGKTEIEMQRILEAYANPSVWREITKRDGYEAKLDTLMPEIIDAAKRNGVDPKRALDTAQRHVLSKYYDAFWKAMNRQDKTKMEEAAESIVRLHSTLDRAIESLQAKEGKIGGKVTPAERRLATEAFGVARKSVPRKTLSDYINQ